LSNISGINLVVDDISVIEHNMENFSLSDSEDNHGVEEQISKSIYKIDKPREYQEKIFEEVKDRNSIVFMETGKGKTYVSVMLMNYIFRQYRKKVIFLVCEGSLVEQQYMVIKNNTTMRIKQFIGGKMTNLLSDPRNFRNIWDENDVFISTPQIIHKILTIGYLKFSEIDLLIFDECHHTDKDHPYNLLMNEFYFFYKLKETENLPQILGLTASPLKKKIESDVQNSAFESLVNLAENLDSDFVIDPDLQALNDSILRSTIESIKEAEKEYIPVKCHLHCDEFDEVANHLFKYLYGRLIDLAFENNEEYMNYRVEYEEYVRLKLQAQDLMEFNQYLCSYKYLYELRKTSFLFHVLEQLQKQIFMLLENVNFEAIIDHVDQYYKLYENNKKQMCEESNQQQPRDLNMKNVNKLIEIFRQFKQKRGLKYESNRLAELIKRVNAIVREDIKKGDKDPNFEGHRIIIFVCNRVVSEYLNNLINKYLDENVYNMMNYKKFKCVNVVGINSKSTKNTHVSKNSIVKLNKNLDLFKCGEAQILIGTSTIEEGLDVKQCDVVMVYTDLRTAKSYIQMKGRARKQNAKFVMFTHNMARTQEYITSFISLITVMRQAFKDSIVGKFKRKDYYENKKLTYAYFFLPTTHSKLTLKNVAVIFNEIKTQFISRKKIFNYKIEYKTDNVQKIPYFKAIMIVERSKDIHPALYSSPIESNPYPDKTSAANHCMLHFLALCNKKCVIDDYFRLS
jgi:ERCC4-related helicase